MTGSSLIALGLTWWQAIISLVVGQLIATALVVLNSLPGAYYHCEKSSAVSWEEVALIDLLSGIPCCESICLGDVWKCIRDLESDSVIYR